VLKEIEDYLLATVRGAIATARIYGFPDNPAELGRTQPQSRILLGYKRANFTKNSIEPVTLQATLQYELTFEVKGLRTHQGAYELLDAVRTTLFGLRLPIPNAQPLLITNEGFVDHDNSIWVYSQGYSLSLILEAGEDIELVPPPVSVPEGVPITVVSGLFRSRVDQVTTDFVKDQDATLVTWENPTP
jgi:hypothetical protein